LPKPKIATPDATTITITSPRFQELSTVTIVSFEISVVALTTGTTVAVCATVTEAEVVVGGTTVKDAVVARDSTGKSRLSTGDYYVGIRKNGWGELLK